MKYIVQNTKHPYLVQFLQKIKEKQGKISQNLPEKHSKLGARLSENHIFDPVPPHIHPINPYTVRKRKIRAIRLYKWLRCAMMCSVFPLDKYVKFLISEIFKIPYRDCLLMDLDNFFCYTCVTFHSLWQIKHLCHNIR